MAQLLSDRRDIDFVLYEQLKVEDILKTEKYHDLNRKMFDMVISEARKPHNQKKIKDFLAQMQNKRKGTGRKPGARY